MRALRLIITNNNIDIICHIHFLGIAGYFRSLLVSVCLPQPVNYCICLIRNQAGDWETSQINNLKTNLNLNNVTPLIGVLIWVSVSCFASKV